jgi:3-deoxy-manno-octulosonate cytidylyltransferase (CMP-KDO synthetase)
MASLMTPILPGEESDPSVVKVVVDKKNFALYFSRSPIPYSRNGGGALPMKHIGVYAYRRNFLLTLAAKEPAPLETAESLEQLRVLENGGAIKMVEVESSPAGVDTPEDLLRVREILEGAHDACS